MKTLLLIALCCMLSGCGKEKLPDSVPLTVNTETITVVPEASSEDPTAEPTPTTIPSVPPTANTEEFTVAPETSNEDPTAEPTPTTIPTVPIQATIYYGNDNADGLEYKTVSIETLNTDTLISELINVGILAEGTAVLSEKHVGSCLYLDFNSVFRDRICSMGTSGEQIIVGSLVNTFVNNFKDTTQSIYITVDGETLESGHVIYDFKLTFFN